MKVNARSSPLLGSRGEDAAVSYLQKRGYTVLVRNFRTKGGEVDIIANVKGTLVFVEVKTRSSSRFGFPEEAVSSTKRHRIALAARRYLFAAHISPQTYIRFDIVALCRNAKTGTDDIVHIENIDIGEEVF